MKRDKLAAMQASTQRRQRSLLNQIATQRAIVARAEARIAELTDALHDAPSVAYDQWVQRRAAEILKEMEVAS